MRIKKVGAICNAGGYYYLLDERDATGEIVGQWLGDGKSAYPLVGLPVMDLENICAMFDITEKKRDKLVMSAPVIKCKKTPRKKCSLVAEVKGKR